MKINKLISVIASSAIFATAAFSIITDGSDQLAENQIEIQKGWKLLGTGYDIPDMNLVFGKDSVATVWKYDSDLMMWKVYSPDPDIQLQIMGSDLVAPMKSLNRNEGYWVLGNYNQVLELNATVNNEMGETPPDTSTLPAQCSDSYYCFNDQLADVQLADISGKSFKLPLQYSHEMTDAYVLATFDNNGVASFDYTNAPTWMQDTYYQDEYTVTYNSTDKTIDVVSTWDSNNISKYKILANETSGMVLGNINPDNYYWNEFSYDGKLIFAFSSTYNKLTPNMSSRIPYTTYNLWDTGDSWRVFNQDGYVEYMSSWNDYTDSWQGEQYNIVDEKIQVLYDDTYDYDGTYYGYKNDDRRFVAGEIGRYRLEEVNSIGTNWQSEFYYGYDDTTYENITLELSSSTDTWQEIFTATDGMIWSEKYVYNTGSTTEGNIYYSYDGYTEEYSYASFKITNNDTRLEVYWEYDAQPWIRDITNVVDSTGTTRIVVEDTWMWNWFEPTSASTIMTYNPNYTGTYRKMTKPKKSKSFKDAFEAKMEKIRKK